MFSQFRHVVEGLAQQPLRSPPDASNPDSLSRSVSLDGSSVDSTISHFRKSLAAQRSGSPGPSKGHASTNSMDVRTSAKARLEDRLRASFAIGEASNTNSPTVSSRTSPAPVPVTGRPSSPSTTPLPNAASPGSHSATINENTSSVASSVPLSAPRPRLAVESRSLDTALSAISVAPLNVDSPTPDSVSLERHPEADISLPDSPTVAEAPAVAEAPTVAEAPAVAETPAVAEAPAAAEAPTVAEVPTSPEGPNVDPDAGDVARDDLLKLPEVITEEATAEEAAELSPVVETAEKGQEETEQAAQPIAATESLSPPALDEVVGKPNLELKSSNSSIEVDVDAMRERLKSVEQRFSDVSTSFKRLQAEKIAADKVLQELTPVQTLRDVDGLRDYLQNFTLKVEMSQDEIRRLNGKLTRQEERIEELRDTHRLESKSQVDLIDTLRKQLEEAGSLINAVRASSALMDTDAARQKMENEKLQAELDKAKASAKDEEEKRTKAISLLKTVRQKLVKSEKERDDAVKELNTAKEQERGEREKDHAERLRLQGEVDKAKADKETMVINLRAQFEREAAALKEKNEREFMAMKGQLELEAITVKASHDQIVAAKNARISGLEKSVQSLSSEKNTLFDQLQLRQAELESSQSHLEVLQSQNTELQYQLRESSDRISLLTEELADSRREQESKARGVSSSAEDVARLLYSTEAKYEAKLSDLRRKLAIVEAERNEIELELGQKLEGKTREAEKIKNSIDDSVKSQQNLEEVINELQAEIERLKEETRTYRTQISQLQADADQVAHIESVAKQQQSELSEKVTALERQIEETRAKESQARAHNKTLRDELRKVQSSAALLERQRNPGVGYWSSARSESVAENQRPGSPALSGVPSRVSSPQPAMPASPSNDEEVNLEYLRNVILQFLEHKEMRPNLIRVLSIILHFTPQETRRLIAKV